MFDLQQIISGGCVAQFVRAPSDRKVAGSVPVPGINAKYLTSTLCGVEE